MELFGFTSQDFTDAKNLAKDYGKKAKDGVEKVAGAIGSKIEETYKEQRAKQMQMSASMQQGASDNEQNKQQVHAVSDEDSTPAETSFVVHRPEVNLVMPRAGSKEREELEKQAKDSTDQAANSAEKNQQGVIETCSACGNDSSLAKEERKGDTEHAESRSDVSTGEETIKTNSATQNNPQHDEAQKETPKEYSEEEDRLHKYCIFKKRVHLESGEYADRRIEIPSSLIATMRKWYGQYRIALGKIADYTDSSEGKILSVWAIYPNKDLALHKWEYRPAAQRPITIIDYGVSIEKEKRSALLGAIKRVLEPQRITNIKLFHCGQTEEDHTISGFADDTVKLITGKTGRGKAWWTAKWANWDKPDEEPVVTDVKVIASKTITATEWNDRNTHYWTYVYWNNLVELEKRGSFDIPRSMGFANDEWVQSPLMTAKGQDIFSGWKDIKAADNSCISITVDKPATEEERNKQYREWDMYDIPNHTTEEKFISFKSKEEERWRQQKEAAAKAAEEKAKKEQQERAAEEERERRMNSQPRYRVPSMPQTQYQQAPAIQSEVVGQNNLQYHVRTANLYVDGRGKVFQPNDPIPQNAGRVPEKSKYIDDPPAWKKDKKVSVREPQKDDFVYASFVRVSGKGNAVFTVDAGNIEKFSVIVLRNVNNQNSIDSCKVGDRQWLKISKAREKEGKKSALGKLTNETYVAELAAFKNGYRAGDLVFAPVSRDEQGDLWAWFGNNLRFQINDSNLADMVQINDVGVLSKRNFVFRIKNTTKQALRDGKTKTVPTLSYIEDTDRDTYFTNQTYKLWDKLPDPDEDDIDFIIGQGFIDWINKEQNQEVAGEIIKYWDDQWGKTDSRFRLVQKRETREWLQEKYAEAYDERRIHLRRRLDNIEGDFELGVFDKKGVPRSLRFRIDAEDNCVLIPLMISFINVDNTFRDYVYDPIWQKDLKSLSQQILGGEEWDYANTKNTQSDKYILRSYIVFSFYKAWLDGNIVENADYGALFNTGLVNNQYEEIYCYLKNNTHTDDFFCRKWEIGGFTTKGNRKIPLISMFTHFPERTVYIGMNNISDVYLDTEREFLWNADHIIGERLYRFPMKFLKKTLRGNDEAYALCEQIENEEADIEELQDFVNEDTEAGREAFDALVDAFDRAVKRAKIFVNWDYRTCVTCYYARTNGISLLLPIRLDGRLESNPDLTLVIDKTRTGTYVGHTVLTLAMAYQDARQIGRPASDWLIPSYIESLDIDQEDEDVAFDARRDSGRDIADNSDTEE